MTQRIENMNYGPAQNGFGQYDSYQQQAQMDRIDQHYQQANNRNLTYKLQLQAQNGGKLFNLPKTNMISPNNPHNQMMKPLAA